MQSDIQIAQEKLALDKEKAASQAQIEMARIQEQTRQNNQKVQVDLFKRGTK